MSWQYYDFENGTQGAAVSNASSGGKIATVSPAGGYVFAAAAARGGSFGMLRSPLDGTAAYARFDNPSPGLTYNGVRFYMPYPATPVAADNVIQLRTVADVLVCDLKVDPTNKLKLFPSGANPIDASDVLTPGASAGYWVECYHVPGADTATSRYVTYVYAQNGTTLLSTYDTGATKAGPTAPAQRFRVGNPKSTTGWTQFFTDSVQWGDRAAVPAGAYVASGNPTTTKSVEQKYWVVDVRTSTPFTGGNTLTFTIAFTSGVNNLATVLEPIDGLFLIPMDAAGTSVYTITTTEVQSGNTSTTTTNVPIAGAASSPAKVIEHVYWNGTAWV